MTARTKVQAMFLGAVLSAGPLLGEEAVRSATWESHCSVCHGTDGRGETEEGRKKKARNLTDPRWLATVSDSRLASSIRRGRDKMPAFGKKLGEEQIKALVAEIRALAPR